jgi:hypothetical protein
VLLLALALVSLSLEAEPEILRFGDDVLFRWGDVLIEMVPCAEHQASADVIHRTEIRLQSAKASGLVPVGVARQVVLTLGARGPLPRTSAPEDIVADDAFDDLINGPLVSKATWFSAESLLEIRTLAEIRARVLAEMN